MEALLIVTDDDIKALLSQYRFERCTLVIPFSAVAYYNDFRILEWSAIKICDYLKHFVESCYSLCYSREEIVFYKECNNMKSRFTVEIPYGNRSAYYDFVYEVNKIVDENGYVGIFVNNMPYSLSSFLVIETNSKAEQVKELINKNKLLLDSSKGLDEFLDEMVLRKWNNATFYRTMSKESMFSVISKCYIIAEEKAIEQRGFKSESLVRKKVFISYCHSNKDLVLKIVDKLEESGVNLWIDKKDISVGEHILESVLSGIRESELAILFLSKDTQNSFFTKYEIKNVMQDMIYKKKAWYIVKIDDVNPDDIFSGMGQFLYYDFLEKNDIDALVSDIIKKIGLINRI